MASTTPDFNRSSTTPPLDYPIPLHHQLQQHNDSGPDTLTQREQDVLDEYARLVENLNRLSSLLATLGDRPSAEILDGLRGLERKTATVFTLLKASVYSIVLQQQFLGEEAEGGVGREGGL